MGKPPQARTQPGRSGRPRGRVIIYCIGLIGANGIDPAVLDE